MNIYFCVRFTYSILGIDAFVKKDFNIIFTSFLIFFDLENKTYWFVKNLSWLYQESVLVLREVRRGSLSNPSWLWEESVTSVDWPGEAKASL